jgi:hypothetical protein
MIATSWRDISISQLSDFESALHEKNEVRKWNRIVSALIKKPLDEVEAMQFSEVAQIIEGLTWLNNIPNQLITEVEIQGITYTCELDPFKMATGQYAHLTEKLQGESFYKWAECAAVMFVPKGEKYNSNSVEARAEIFWEHMTADIIYPYCSFFLTLLNELQQHTLRSLKNQLIQVKKELSSMETEAAL